MAIKKVSNGILFEDDFKKHNLLWTITPLDSTRYEYTDFGVVLKHGDGRVIMSMPSPYNYNEYTIEAEFDHAPTILSDVGGMVFMSTTDDSIECQSYFNHLSSNNKNYRYIRVIYKEEVYQFLVSEDGIKWEEAGNSRLVNSNQFGFFLDGVQEQQSTYLLARNIKIQTSRYATIRGINSNGDIVIIKDADGNDVSNIGYTIEKGAIKLDLSQCVNPIELNVKIRNGATNTTLFDSDLQYFSCGDIYETDEDVLFYIDGNLIESIDSIFNLGTLSGRVNYVDFNLLNNSDDNVLINKELSIDKFSPHSTGHEKVKIAVVEDGVDIENLDYKEVVKVDEILPKETLKCVLKIERQGRDFIPSADSSYRFKINLE